MAKKTARTLRRLALVCGAVLLCGQLLRPYEARDIPDAGEEPPGGGRYGGTLVFSTPAGESATVLGYPATASNSLAIMIAAPVVEQLFRLDEEGAVQPWLVESYTQSGDGLSYTFHLRRGVRFHDGTAFNAQAVKWNLERCMEEGRNASVTDNIASVAVTGEDTLLIQLHQVDFQFLGTLTGNIGMIVSPTAVTTHGVEWACSHPVGTGPFVFQGWEVDSKIVYTRNDDYWMEGLPYLDGIEYHIIKDSAVMAAAFQQGELQVIAQVTDTLLDSLSQQEGCVKTVARQAAYGYMFWFSSADADSPFSQLAVRQAALYGIDMQAIAAYLIGDTGGYTNQLSGSNSVFYNPEIVGYPYDPERARALLAQAGYPEGFSTALYLENTDSNVEIGSAVQAYLNQIGIRVEVVLMDAAQYYEKIILNGWQDGIALVKFGYAPNEFSSMKGLLSRETIAQRMPALALPEAFFDAVDEARLQRTEAEAVPYVQRAQEILIDQWAAGAGWIAKSVTVKKETVRGDHFSSLGRYVQWTPETTWLAD